MSSPATYQGPMIAVQDIEYPPSNFCDGRVLTRDVSAARSCTGSS